MKTGLINEDQIDEFKQIEHEQGCQEDTKGLPY